MPSLLGALSVVVACDDAATIMARGTQIQSAACANKTSAAAAVVTSATSTLVATPKPSPPPQVVVALPSVLMAPPGGTTAPASNDLSPPATVDRLSPKTTGPRPQRRKLQPPSDEMKQKMQARRAVHEEQRLSGRRSVHVHDSLSASIKKVKDCGAPGDDALYTISALVPKTHPSDLLPGVDVRDRLGIIGRPSGDEERLYGRTQRLKWRRSILRDLASSSDDRSTSETMVSDFSELSLAPSSIHYHHHGATSPAVADLSEIFIPCANAACPIEASLWSGEEKKAWCPACWNNSPFHLAVGLAVDPTVLNAAGVRRRLEEEEAPAATATFQLDELGGEGAPSGSDHLTTGRYFTHVKNKPQQLVRRDFINIGWRPPIEALAKALPNPIQKKNFPRSTAAPPPPHRHPVGPVLSPPSNRRLQLTGLAKNLDLAQSSSASSESHNPRVLVFNSKAVFVRY